LESNKQYFVNWYTKRSFLDFDEFPHLKDLLVQLKLHLVFRGDVFLVQPFEY